MNDETAQQENHPDDPTNPRGNCYNRSLIEQLKKLPVLKSPLLGSNFAECVELCRVLEIVEAANTSEINAIKDERYKRGYDDGYDAAKSETVSSYVGGTPESAIGSPPAPTEQPVEKSRYADDYGKVWHHKYLTQEQIEDIQKRMNKEVSQEQIVKISDLLETRHLLITQRDNKRELIDPDVIAEKLQANGLAWGAQKNDIADYLSRNFNITQIEDGSIKP